MKKILTILLTLICFAANSTIFYISTTGSNANNGSIGSPWLTLDYACTQVTTPGDIIHVNAGTYTETQICELAVGVSIEGVGVTSIIKSTLSADYVSILELQSGSEGTNGNQSISFLKFDGNNRTTSRGIIVTGRSNVSIHDITIVDFNFSGVIFKGRVDNADAAPTTYATGNTFYNNTLTNCSAFTGGVGRGGMEIGGQEGMLIYNNVMSQTGRTLGTNGYVIKYSNSGYCKGLKIYSNTITKEPFDNITYNFAIELWYTQGGLEIYNNTIIGAIDVDKGVKGSYAFTVDIHHNVLGPTSPQTYREDGIHLEGGCSDAIVRNNYFRNVFAGVTVTKNTGNFVYNNCNVYNNVADRGRLIEFDAIDNTGTYNGWNIWNNTCYSKTNDHYAIILPGDGAISNFSIKNNIIVGYDLYPLINRTLTSGSTFDILLIENNIFYNNGNSNVPGYDAGTTNVTVQNNITSNPLLISTTDLRLQSGSPAIGAGLNVGLTIDHSDRTRTVPLDIGAYEYSAITTYYITNIGSDAAAGTSAGTAWQTISKVNGSTFNPLDSILFKRGNVWREQLTIPSSGTVGNRITFGAYWTGAKPIINGADIETGWTDAGSNQWYINNPNAVTTRAMVVIDNVIYAEVASLAAVNSANEYFIDLSTSPDRVYVYSTDDPDLHTVEVSNREYCIVTAAGASSKKYIEIADIEVRYAGRAGIYFEGPGSGGGDALNGASYVRRCKAYANRIFGIAHYDHYDSLVVEDSRAEYNGNGFYSWVADEGTFRRDTTNNQIYYTVGAGSSDGHGFGGYQADNWLVENCNSDQDNDAIRFDAGGVSADGIIRYNKVFNSKTGTPPTPGMGVGNIGAGALVQIYYNLIVNCAGAGFTLYTAASGTVHFYNNTIFLADGYGTEEGTMYLLYGTGFILKNNIFARMGADGKTLLTIGTNLPTSDYNQWYQGPLSAYRWHYNGSNYSTLALWRTGSSQDANSQSGDPLFVNQASDWSLQSGSPAINAGVSVGLTVDILGNPIVGNPDIGAYEYSSSPTTTQYFLHRGRINWINH